MLFGVPKRVPTWLHWAKELEETDRKISAAATEIRSVIDPPKRDGFLGGSINLKVKNRNFEINEELSFHRFLVMSGNTSNPDHHSTVLHLILIFLRGPLTPIFLAASYVVITVPRLPTAIAVLAFRM